jgi:hypothetical protein
MDHVRAEVAQCGEHLAGGNTVRHRVDHRQIQSRQPHHGSALIAVRTRSRGDDQGLMPTADQVLHHSDHRVADAVDDRQE